jgi:hypothetical protein
MGPRVEWQRVAGEGRNALDFFIACHLGRVLERAPGTECIVLSRDKGFDPLLRQLNESGLRCRRIASRSELAAKSQPRPAARQSAQPADPRYQRALAVLRNLEKRSRPRNRKRLAQVISAIFQREIAQKEVNRIVDALLAAGLISEADNTISYTL